MAFQLSPGINVSEIDLTNAVPAVATSEGAFVGTFRWGPTNERVLLSSEVDLITRFGRPYSVGGDNAWTNHESFFSAANFLSYSDALYTVRVADSTAEKAEQQETLGQFHAKYVGKLGDSLQIIACDSDADSFNYELGAPTATGIQSQIAMTQNSYEGTVTGASNSDEAGKKIFDPSATDVGTNSDQLAVNTTNGVFTIPGHGFQSGQRLIYRNRDANADVGTNQNIDGLDHDSRYFVTVLDVDTFTLSGSLTGAAIVPADVGAGTTHELAVAAITAPLDNFYEVGGIVQIGDDNYTIMSVGVDGSNVATLRFNKKWYGATGDTAYKYFWKGSTIFDKAPDAGRIHVAVIDRDGGFTGQAGSVLESFANVSLVQGTKYFDGSSAFAHDVINLNSGYISVRVGDDNNNDQTIADPDEADLINQSTGINVSQNGFGRLLEDFGGGDDGLTESDNNLNGSLLQGWDLFKNAEEVDVSLLVTGRANKLVANYVMDNIAEYRKDCVAFVSPQLSDDDAVKIVAFADELSGSSYSVMDSGYKYQYDKYNDVYRWVPMNADVAGSCARTDDERDPWFSPAGYSRGQIKNVVKLKLNPNKTQRDLLYKNNVNPVIIEPGSGAILFGDKTMQRNPSAFDRINVRRLFIVLEKAIALASKSTLFEFNDDFTRATFRNMIEPFLRDVQGRRGIYDFAVVCDQTNNTSEVIDTNRFIGDIYIKPARSINFIQLNFVAVRTGVEFNEIIGQ
jgi:hypothetical protein